MENFYRRGSKDLRACEDRKKVGDELRDDIGAIR